MAELPEILTVDDEITLVPTPGIDPSVLLGLVRDNLPELADWMVWATDDYSMESAAAFIEQSAALWDQGSRRNYMIDHRGRICGNLGIFRLESPARDFEVGYWLDARSHGKGVMTRSCKALLSEAFGLLGGQLVQIKAASENTKSRAVAVRLGMIEEGTLRRRSNNARGELLDLVVYSITAEEWRANQSD